MLKMIKPLAIVCPVCKSQNSLFLWLGLHMHADDNGLYFANCVDCNMITNNFIYSCNSRKNNDYFKCSDDALYALEHHLMYGSINTSKIKIDICWDMMTDNSIRNLERIFGIKIKGKETEYMQDYIEVYLQGPLPPEIAVSLELCPMLNEAGPNFISIFNHLHPQVANKFNKKDQSILSLGISNIKFMFM